MLSFHAITDYDALVDDHHHLDDPSSYCSAASAEPQTRSLLMTHADHSLDAVHFPISSSSETTSSAISFYPTTPTALQSTLPGNWSHHPQHHITTPPSTCASSPALPLPSPNTMVRGPYQQGGDSGRGRRRRADDTQEDEQQQLPAIDVESAGPLPYVDEQAYQLQRPLHSPNPSHRQQDSLSVPTPMLGGSPLLSTAGSPSAIYDPQLTSTYSPAAGHLSQSPSMSMPLPPSQWQQTQGTPSLTMSAPPHSAPPLGAGQSTFVQTPLEYSRRSSLDNGAPGNEPSYPNPNDVPYGHLAPGSHSQSGYPYERHYSGSSRSRGSSRSSTTMAHSRLGWPNSREGTTDASSSSSGGGAGGYFSSQHDSRNVVGYAEVPTVPEVDVMHADGITFPAHPDDAYRTREQEQGDYRYTSHYNSGLSTSSSLPSLNAAYYHHSPSSGAQTYVPSPQMSQHEWRSSGHVSSAMLSPVSPGAPFFSPQLAPPPFLRRHTSETAFPMSQAGGPAAGPWSSEVPLIYEQARFSGAMPYPPPNPYATFASGNPSPHSSGSQSMPKLRRANSGPSRPSTTSPTRSTAGASKLIIACRECRRESTAPQAPLLSRKLTCRSPSPSQKAQMHRHTPSLQQLRPQGNLRLLI